MQIKKPKCWKCKSKDSQEIKIYVDKNSYKRILYKCNKCNSMFNRIKLKAISIIRKACPYCKEFKVVSKGTYFVKVRPHWRRRYYCTNCKKHFNGYRLLNRKTVGRWDARVFRKVKKLINEKRIFPYKFDNRKDKTYPSSRMIVFFIKKKFNIKISSSTVNLLIQKYRISENSTEIEGQKIF